MPQKLVVFTFLLFSLGFLSSAYCNTGIILADNELDNVYVGGFDLNLEAAYAFRSAVIDQSNIATAISSSAKSGNDISITGTNSAVLRNGGDLALAIQRNVSTVIARMGDIKNAVIQNFNFADVGNIFGDQGDAGATSVTSDPVAGEAPSALTPSSDSVVSNSPASSTPTDSLPVNNVPTGGSANVVQTNIAAVIALEGNIQNTKISNINFANAQDVGNLASATQVNIAVVLAKGIIENTEIANTNIANVVNTNTVNSGGVGMTVSFNNAKANQVSIIFVKSLVDNFKNKLLSDLNLGKVVNFR